MNARLNAPAAAVRGTRKRIRENSLLAQTAIHLFFIAACAACLIPLILVTIVSFTDERSILANGYIAVRPGEQVQAGDTLIVIEAMKMENEFKASAAGTVVEVRVQPGQAVNPGDTLVVIE